MCKSNDSVDRIAETAEATICVGRELLRSVQAFSIGLERRLSEMEDVLDCIDDEDDPYEVLDRMGLNDYERYVRNRIESIYLTATRPTSGDLVEIEDGQLASAQMFGIRAEWIDNSIVVRLPILGSMYRRRSDGSRPYGHIFASEVEAVVRELVSNMEPEVIDTFRAKTIAYVFAYPSNEKYILDGDNHDTKAITDAICAPFLSTDSGSSTVFISRTVLADDLQPGTYVVLSPGTKGVSYVDALIRIIGDDYDDNTKNSV